MKSVLLEFAWAIKYLQTSNAPVSSLFELFKIKKNAQMEQMFKELLKSKKLNSYFFEIEGNKVNIKDISSLDAGSEESGIANFGGLTDFASVASELVSKYVTDEWERKMNKNNFKLNLRFGIILESILKLFLSNCKKIKSRICIFALLLMIQNLILKLKIRQMR